MTCLKRLGLTTFAIVAFALFPRAAFTQGPGKSPAPEWLTWKVFHESLVAYGEQPGARLDGMLSGKFGLGKDEAGVLLSAGQSFLTAINVIDAEARAEVQRRYGADPPAGLVRTTPAPSGRPIVLERGKTLLDMVRESGLYAQVEAKKQATLAAHIGQLQRAIAPARLESLAAWTRTAVAPRIVTADRGSPVSGINRSSPGDGRYSTHGSPER